MKIYLAGSYEHRDEMARAKKILTDAGHELYIPFDTKIPNAWDYPNNEWGLMVFTADIEAIEWCDALVLLSYGRMGTAGCNWEAGYAYAKGKKVFVVEMTDDIMSLMVANGRYATIKGLDKLACYDWRTMPKTRTGTEQK